MKLAYMDRIFSKLSLERVDCKHHSKGVLVVENKKILSVYHSFGKKEMPRFVVDKVAKSMGLSKAELQRMGKCKISKDEYLSMLTDRGWL